MRTKTIRLIVLLGTVSIVGIMFMQFVWFKKAFDLKQRQFEQTIFLSLQTVAERIMEFEKVQIPIDGLVNQLSSNYFAVNINGEIETGLLEFLLKTEFKKRNIVVPFEYGVYNCDTKKMVYGNHLSENLGDEAKSLAKHPVWNNDKYYFTVYFPQTALHLIGELRIWLWFNLAMVVVCLFFGFTLFVLFKQKQLSEVQKDFMNNMTHEFKTPISTILVSADLLAKPEILENRESIQEYSGIIGREALRLKSAVDRVLQIAILDKRKVQYERKVVDLHLLIHEVTHAMAVHFLEKPGKIDLLLKAQLVEVKADAIHLTNVLSSIIDNAIKYCRKEPEITISTKNVGRNMIITINDNGIGIQNTHAKRVFDKFYREPTGNIHQTKGFGLGLYYAKEVVLAHGGKINIDSQKNNGTTVTIRLPLMKRKA